MTTKVFSLGVGIIGTWVIDDADVMVVALSEVYYHDMSVAAICGLPFGCIAERDSIDSDWWVYSVE